MSELSSMKNIGKVIEKRLKAAGIHTAEELRNLGSREAFIKLKNVHTKVCLVHLYTLQGAVENIEYNLLPPETKRKLKEFSDKLKTKALK